jgi:transposase-like protein
MSNITSTAGDVPHTHSSKESFWRDTLAAFSASGQSVQSFCQARGLKPPTFYSWRLKLAEHDRQAETGVSPKPARSRATQRQSTGPAFLPVVVEPRAAGVEETLQVELRGGRVLRLPASMPAARLAEVLHALEGQP